MCLPKSVQLLMKQVNEIRAALDARKSEFEISEFSEIMPDCFPPCMAHALSGAQSGVNLSIL